jgi:hypothetical protein
MSEYSNQDINKDLVILKKQIDISKNEGIKLLKKNNGDISKCILEFYDYKDISDKNPYEDRCDNDPHKKLFELRKILDEKDAFFTEMMEKKANNRNTDR